MGSLHLTQLSKEQRAVLERVKDNFGDDATQVAEEMK